MKRTVLNLGAILVAFIIGIAINNACADSLEKMSDSELRNLVARLQEEVNSLKSRVAELEGKVGNNSGTNISTGDYAFEVDGIHFSMSGGYCDPIDYYEYGGSYQIINGVRSEVTPGGTIVRNIYDSYGRFLGTKSENSTYVSEVQYSYSNKTVTYKSLTTYKDPKSNGGLSESGTSYVYHLK